MHKAFHTPIPSLSCTNQYGLCSSQYFSVNTATQEPHPTTQGAPPQANQGAPPQALSRLLLHVLLVYTFSPLSPMPPRSFPGTQMFLTSSFILLTLSYSVLHSIHVAVRLTALFLTKTGSILHNTIPAISSALAQLPQQPDWVSQIKPLKSLVISGLLLLHSSNNLNKVCQAHAHLSSI